MRSHPTLDLSNIPSSSRVFRAAAGIEPIGTPVAESCVCAMCAAQLEKGELGTPVVKDTFDDAFNNKLDIHHKGSVTCGDCVALWTKDFLQSYSKSYATSSGVYKLSSNEDVQAFLLRPPTQPYVAIFNCRQQQHMIWRTPVCLSADFPIVRVDDEILQINRSLALEGARAWREAEQCMKTIGMKGLPAKLDRTLNDFQMGVIRPDVVAAVSAHSPEGAKAIASLKKLRMAEWWALCALRYIDQDAPDTWPVAVRLLPVPVAA